MNKDQLIEKGFKATKYKNIWINENIEVLNAVKNRILKVNDKGYFVFDGKRINSYKLALEVFKKQPMRKGQTEIINCNEKYTANNIQYKNTVKVEPPKYEDLMKCIKKRFKEVQFNVGANTVVFKMFVYELAKVSLIDKTNKEYELFEYYLKSKVSKFKACKEKNYRAITGINIINSYLNKVVEFHLKK
ncbi:hypothetical protein P3875_01250 [Myroides sp. JBRI-B21084]|uniref:hypothetical protein n=1 Tax=Myroides sp. JBRI-B21084 TaxID=3119977 RepID=UPI0026E2DB1D|nr:hypothetical protein [Paenimyroides cloacae]WKW46727.1 hypothetical protein P3875_01250 [Paenimyroides cloacae]